MPRIQGRRIELSQDYVDGYNAGFLAALDMRRKERPAKETMLRQLETGFGTIRSKPKRKLSAWNKFVKANSNKKIYKFANGKLKLKKMGIAFRKTRAGKKK